MESGEGSEPDPLCILIAEKEKGDQSFEAPYSTLPADALWGISSRTQDAYNFHSSFVLNTIGIGTVVARCTKSSDSCPSPVKVGSSQYVNPPEGPSIWAPHSIVKMLIPLEVVQKKLLAWSLQPSCRLLYQCLVKAPPYQHKLQVQLRSLRATLPVV